MLPTTDEHPDLTIDRLRARVAELERENKILTSQRDEYRECCSSLETHGTPVMVGWISVPGCEWEQAFRPLHQS